MYAYKKIVLYKESDGISFYYFNDYYFVFLSLLSSSLSNQATINKCFSLVVSNLKQLLIPTPDSYLGDDSNRIEAQSVLT